MSGSRVFERGVGTQRQTTSHRPNRLMSVVASRSPAARRSDIDSSSTSPMWLCPSFTPDTIAASTSKPRAWLPLRAISTAKGRPT